MRLTIKKNNKYNIACEDNKGVLLKYSSAATEEVKQIVDKCNAVFKKLGQLEDIEEELGIDLLTLFKALSGEYAVKEDDGHISVEWSCPRFYAPAIMNAGFNSWISIRGRDEEKQLYLKDYGVTWALTKEELK